MRTFACSVAFSLLAACGASEPCTCAALTGPIACGASACQQGVGYQCSAAGALLAAPEACGVACVPATCGSRCGDLPDDCGGTLHCGACAMPCDGVTCSAGQTCNPSTGRCEAGPCAAAGAVCGSVQGVSCGTCPSGATCATTQRACVQKVATLPLYSYASSAALLGDRLYVSGPATSGAMGNDLYEVTLSTGQSQRLVTGTVSSHLAQNGASLFFIDKTAGALKKLTPGAMTPDTLPGVTWCSSLAANATTVFCGIGGDAKYGVSGFGVKKLPIAGGTASWLVDSLNYPHLSLSGSLLFYVGTTDNQYSFGNLGVYDLAGSSPQWLVSGGALDSSFMVTDDQAWYFVENTGAGSKLWRNAFTANDGTELAVSDDGFLEETTLATGSEVLTFAKLGGTKGLWRIPAGAPATRQLVLADADTGMSMYGPSHLLGTSAAPVFISGTSVYRAFRP